jgi:hypothetical protein
VRQDVCIFRHVAAHINVDVGHRMLFRLEFHIENRFLNLCFHCPDRKDSEEGLSSSRQAQWILVAKRASRESGTARRLFRCLSRRIRQIQAGHPKSPDRRVPIVSPRRMICMSMDGRLSTHANTPPGLRTRYASANS